MLTLALPLTSCGRVDGPALYPVRGRVMCRGEPASGAQVVLIPEAPPAPGTPSTEPPSATVAEDGSFDVATGDRGYGAVPGRYKVLITWRTGLATDAAKEAEAAAKKTRRRAGPVTKPDKHSMLAPDRLKGRYADPSHSTLTAEVKAGKNDLAPFELTD
jgi:hypothetical protein